MTNVTRHSDQMIEGLLVALHELIPSANISCKTVQSLGNLAKKGFTLKGTKGNAGAFFPTKGQIEIWFDLSHGDSCLLHIEREHVPLTPEELSLLGHVPAALSGLLVAPGSRASELAQRIAARISFATILVAKFLRGGQAVTFWTPMLILAELEQLTFRRYEGHPCTSGFVYTSQPELYAKRLPIQDYDFVPFDNPVIMMTNAFEGPASFRYVDGRNSFYLIDNSRKIQGFFVASDSRRFSLVERSSSMHVVPLVQKMPGRVWAGFIGQNDDVDVITSKNVYLRWNGNHWHLRDKSILTTLLKDHGCAPDLSDTLSMVCFALSDLRRGTVILIPDNDNLVPRVSGSIDNSELGNSLTSAYINRPFKSLIDAGSIVGLLTSDGMTTISKGGKILSSGKIIDISDAARDKPAGGGRTHAAFAASIYGLAIKVSEDGPISVFRNRALVIKM